MHTPEVYASSLQGPFTFLPGAKSGQFRLDLLIGLLTNTKRLKSSTLHYSEHWADGLSYLAVKYTLPCHTTPASYKRELTTFGVRGGPQMTGTDRN